MNLHVLVASLLWSLLAASVLLTFVGLRTKRWLVPFLAAGLSLAVSIPALASIGLFLWLPCTRQLALGVRLYREERAPPG